MVKHHLNKKILALWCRRRLDMSAYSALLTLIQSLEQITAERDDYCVLFTDHKQKIECLLEKFRFLQSFLENSPPKDEQVMISLERLITRVAYQVQDNIEFYISDQISNSKKMDFGHKALKSSLRLFCLVQKDKSLRYQREKLVELGFQNTEKVNHYLHMVVEEVDSFLKEVTAIIQSRKVIGDASVDAAGSSRVTPILKSSLVGFDDDMLEIKAKLCGESSKLEVISLVGMGGSGKTTLSRNIFDDSLITYHFDVRAWVTISQNCHLKNVLVDLLNSITGVNENTSQVPEDALLERVYKKLRGLRYLIVLDDVWSSQIWDDLRRIFPDDNNGSRIVLTTRLSDVGASANSFGDLHQMRFLDHDESWNLLQDKVFGEERCPLYLEEIGKLIAKSCRGLPLAIVVVGGLLSKASMTINEWENISRNVSLAVSASDNASFSKILLLSYSHLPHHLKPCFLYIGGFRDDYEIPVFKLINLWIAEGLLKPNGSKSPEEVSEEYLQELVNRSLVVITKKSYNGKFKCCSMHKLLRDLCVQKAEDENFFHVMNVMQEEINNERRLRFPVLLPWGCIKLPVKPSSPVRSIFCRSYDHMVVGFRLLRVLEILISLQTFPVEILYLFHLKYLALTESYTRRCALPPSIHKLQNLQTLIIRSPLTIVDRGLILYAELEISKMPLLKHLICDNVTLSSVTSTDGTVSILENLQTLSRVRNFRFTNEAIDMIPNLKKLKIIYSGKSCCKKRSEDDLNNISRLCHFETLNLKFEPEQSSNPNWWRDRFRIRFRMPLNLVKLTLEACGFPWEDMTVLGSLPNLEVLKLLCLSFIGEEWEPMEGEFTRLKILLIDSLDLKCWRADESHFPRLERLTIRRCSQLKEIPSEIGEILTLQVIEVESQ